MEFFATILLAVGVTGLALSTTLIPCAIALAVTISSLWRGARWPVSDDASGLSLARCSVALVIPVFNDADLLTRTLKNLQLCLSKKPKSTLGNVRVIVVADGCSEDSVSIARAAGVEVLANEQNLGKWSSIKRGALEAARLPAGDHPKRANFPDWIGFVDCGVEWQSDFIERAAKYLTDSSVVALAPAYRHKTSTVFSRCLWKMEATFKRFESLARGPVSVHGATVLYRTAPLLAAFDRLGNEKWLNDDVVLPMMVRCLCPSQRIVYREDLQVFDRSPRAPERATAQRHRMMHGNLQWIRLLLPMVARADFPTFFVAMRRVARVFWAYWVAFVLVGCTVLILGTTGTAAPALTVFFSTLFVSVLCRGSAAARASLRAPLSLLTDSGAFGRVQWR